MDRYVKLFEYFRQCPALKDLWSIAAVEDLGVKVILPIGASSVMQYSDKIDVTGTYVCNMVPYPSVYEDYQINCYMWYDENDNNPPSKNDNVLTLEEVQEVCDWIKEQNSKQIFPEIGEQVVSVECVPFIPLIRYVNQQENTVGYYITVRIRYVNHEERRYIEYGGTS